jgi:cytochrome c oxidase assembly factor CtaG
MSHLLLAVAAPPALPPPTLPGALGDWTLDPVALLVVLLAGGAYLLGVRRLAGRGERWPAQRSICFLVLGLGSLVVVTMGWFGVYAHTLFSAYAVQIVVLLMVTPVLLALGAPASLAVAALPPGPATRLSKLLDFPALRLFRYPVASSLVLAIVPFVLYFTGWYEQTLWHQGWYELLHVQLLVIGLVSFLWLAETDSARRPVYYSVAFFIAFTELIFDALPGIVVRLTNHVLAHDYYAAVGRTWGPSLLADQRIGGAVLWFVGETADLPLLAILLVLWIRADRAEAARIDRELDQAAAPSLTPRTRAEEAAVRSRPWWETDPSVFGERARRYGWGTGRRDGRP